MDMNPSIVHFASLNKLLVVDGAAAAANLGVRRVAEGDLNRAMLLFREALVAVKTAFADDKLDSSSISRETLDLAAQRIAQAEEHGVTPNAGSSFMSMSLFPLDASTLKAAVSNPVPETAFTHPFSLPAPRRRNDTDGYYYFCSDDVDVDSALFSAVIIYNMAVTTHKMGGISPAGQRRDILRQRTCSLYDMCYQLLSNASEQVVHHDHGDSQSSTSLEVTSIGRAMFDLMCMAIVNNKAELYSETVDNQLTFVHIDKLVELATSVREQRYGEEALNTVVQTAVQFFLANAHQSGLVCIFCAAPAA
jgi:hypothetical protein